MLVHSLQSEECCTSADDTIEFTVTNRFGL